MKVLHLVAGPLTSNPFKNGAAKGAYWLHLGLKKIGLDSKILTNGYLKKEEQDIETITKNKYDVATNLFRKNLDQILLLPYQKKQKRIFNTGFWGFDFTKTSIYRNSDIIHLHWINNGFVKIKHLAKVKKPIVWTIRDMWPMTGGCHYSMNCKKYRQGCGNCKQLGSKFKHDLSRLVVNRKKKYFPQDIKIVGISDWISSVAKESELFKNYDIRTIYNTVETDQFFPLNKDSARNILGLKTNKKIILAGAQSLSDFYKGFDKLLEAMKRIDNKKYFLLFFGRLDENLVSNLGFEYKSLGFLNDEISLRAAYSAADVFVAPSVMEAFGKTIVEAMACGTPVVCFNATGPKDIVEHKITGYKAEPFEPADLAKGIDWVTGDKQRSDRLIKKAKNSAKLQFSNEVIAKKYSSLYKEMLTN